MYYLQSQYDAYMLPCLNKKHLGFECAGCGLQRAIALLLNGQIIDSFVMYPGLYTLIALFGCIIINSIKALKNGSKIITILAVINTIVILGSYFLKLIIN